MPKQWKNKELIAPTAELVSAAGSKILAELLMQRGIDTPEKAAKFLNPIDITPVSPYAYSDMEKAVNRIKYAIENNEKILVYGDFDADGVTSTAVLHKTLSHLGAKFLHYIPDRQTESHGMNKAILLKKISKEQVKLIVTVDCGISNIEEVALVKSIGADVIITDHHEAKDELPAAVAILDAKAEGALREDLSLDDINSLTSMAGVGAAFKLACALLEEYNQLSFTEELLPLVAVGTVADIMPLLHENRLFTALGIKLIAEGKNPGITTLLNIAGVNAEENLTSEKIAFSLAPRINAAGRLDSAETAFKLLTSDNPSEIAIAAQTLNNFNKMRQELSDNIYLEALSYIEKNCSDEDCALVAYNPNWHIGIVGIVASRLVEKFNRPVFMFTDSPDGGFYRCSARSVEGVNIFDVLEINADILNTFGGHSMAAGLSLDKNVTAIQDFSRCVNKTIFEMTDGEIPKPVLNIDLEIELSDLSDELLKQIERMQPFGEANPYPVFAVKNLKLVSERTMGQNNKHLKFTCEDLELNTADCVFWNSSTLNVPAGKSIDIAFYPKINEFNGVRSLRLDIKDYNSPDIIVKKSTGGISRKIIDHRKKTGILAQVADYIGTSQKKFKIFAEDKEIIKKISEQKEIAANIINRLTTEQADQLMFFDYPADKNLLEFVLKAANPQVVHFMNYHTPPADIDELITKISGMMRYAVKKYYGKVYLPEIASALSISDDLAKFIIKLLNRVGVIRVREYDKGTVYFDFLGPVSIAELKSHELYEKCRMELFKSKNFRDRLVSAQNLAELVKTV